MHALHRIAVLPGREATALDNKQPYDPYQQYTVNWGYNRDVFSLAWVEPGVTLASVQPQLEAVAKQVEQDAASASGLDVARLKGLAASMKARAARLRS